MQSIGKIQPLLEKLPEAGHYPLGSIPPTPTPTPALRTSSGMSHSLKVKANCGGSLGIAFRSQFLNHSLTYQY